jgi:hypothetical protein
LSGSARSLGLDPSPLLQGGTIEVPLVGDSMRPLLRDGDRVRVRALVAGEPARGQLVLHVQRGRFVLHRVLRVNETRVKTRGDACWSADAPVERVAVLGVASAVHRCGVWLPLEWPLVVARGYRRGVVAARIGKRLLCRRSRRSAP